MKHATPKTILLALTMFALVSLWPTAGRAQAGVGETKSIRVFAVRLKPGQDLRKELETFARDNHIRAGFIITTVGSLRHAAIRFADQQTPANLDGKFEIVSLVGTLGPDGVHLHVSLSDSTGRTVGGHLVEGCLVYTTAEIVIGDASGLTFSREKDSETGYQELRIRQATKPARRARH
ncbi:MAG TPA: PPC domain-containing DNA-binding protein [Pyrinomonadaceae bacterium]|nr:PPC domain-containing DNA-binding protein [Pyrinomonadaceae bacterium]